MDTLEIIKLIGSIVGIVTAVVGALYYIFGIKAKNSEQDKDIDNIEKKVEKMEHTVKENKDKLNNRIADAEKKHDEFKEEITNKYNSIDKRLFGIEGKLDTTLDFLKELVAKHDDKIGELEKNSIKHDMCQQFKNNNNS